MFDAKLFLLCAMHIDLVVVLANCHHGKRHLCSLVQQVVVHKHCSKQFFLSCVRRVEHLRLQ